MCNVALPAALRTVEQVSRLQQRLMLEHRISIACHYVPHRDQYYSCSSSNSGGSSTGSIDCSEQDDTTKPRLIHFVRLSAQVYLELSDFELLADTVLKLVPEITV